ncbi:MAG: pyridoxamine 5'-phosphate oxidase family protein [Chlamydiales bacterium]
MSLAKRKDFEFDVVLQKPLMAHLSTVEVDEPRDSPVWFIWEDDCVWIFGTSEDSFVRRLKTEPRCALGIVDFDLDKGVLKHVGIRGISEVGSIDNDRLNRFVAKYLGDDKTKWNEWFVENIVDPLDIMVKITPKSMVAKDVSFFRTGPDLAN